MKRKSILLAASLATLSGVAAAQMDDADRNRSSRHTPVFTEVDTDRSDLLDREEVGSSDPDADFDEMDQDDDGKVNRNEYFQYHRR